MAQRKLLSDEDLYRKTQSGSLRDLSEGSEEGGLVGVPDPISNDRDNLENSKRWTPSLPIFLMLLLLPFVSIVTFISGEMVAVLSFSLIVFPILILGLVSQL